MTDSDRYLAHAAECDRMARKAMNAADKAAFERMAADWRALAEALTQGATSTHPK